MSKRNVHSAPWRLYLDMFSLNAALHFLSLWKIVYFENIFFYFPLSKDFPSCMKSPVEGETYNSASLHFCAFGLLECIVNNQRNKGTWMGREERSRGAENELVVHFRQVLGFHSVQIHLEVWSTRILQL